MRVDKAEAHASAAHTDEGRRNLSGSGAGAEAGSGAAGRTKPEAPRWMEAVVERSNMLCAYERVVGNEGAPGVDGRTVAELKPWLKAHWAKVRQARLAGEYMPAAVRKVDIPKPQGGVRTLGIPTVEDRLLQRAVARILEAVFEADFLECSYGFRPGCNPHGALRALRGIIVTKKVGHLFEADIRGYFNHIQHKWLQKMVAHRIADPFILRLIGKWLNAGFMVGGVVTRTEEGSPQGGPISPILSNIYLQFVLDLWFEKKIRPTCQGEAYLTRFADDFVANFQYGRDAEAFHKNLTDRFGKFGLELAEEKTRVMRFGRFVRADLAKTGEKPDTFDFLGFKHVCGTDRGGKFALVRVPCDKSRRKFLAKTKEWLSQHRHWKRRDQQKQLVLMLRGFYQYFGLHHCKPKLDGVRHEVHRQWARRLRRRSQRHRLYWSYLLRQSWFELPYAVSTLHATV